MVYEVGCLDSCELLSLSQNEGGVNISQEGGGFGGLGVEDPDLGFWGFVVRLAGLGPCHTLGLAFACSSKHVLPHRKSH